MMDIRKLIDDTNAKGHFGVRGTDGGQPTEDDRAVEEALRLGLIRLITGWRSDPRHPIDRRIYGLTRRGWAFKVSGGTEVMQNWLTSVMADAEAAHWGAVDEGATALRYDEEFFTEQNTLPPHRETQGYNTPAHQHPHVVMDSKAKLHDIKYNPDVDWMPPRDIVYPFPAPNWKQFLFYFVAWLIVLGSLAVWMHYMSGWMK